jgi:hypothetical protein
MGIRTNITLAPEMQRRAQAKADALGITLQEYVLRLVDADLAASTQGLDAQGFQEREAPGRYDSQPTADISIFFDLIDEGAPTNIAPDKDKLVGQAAWEEYLDETRRRPRRRRK